LPGLAEQFIWYAAIVMHVWLVLQFWRLRLIARYPAIFSVVLLQLVRSAWVVQYTISPEIFQTHANQYFFTILFTEPILIAVRVAAVFEFSREILHSYRGLSILGRATMAITLSASLAVSLFLHWAEFTFTGEPYRWLRVMYLLETTVYSALLVFLLLLALFVLYHPAPIRRNLLAHGAGFGMYMVSSAAAVWLRNQDAAQWTRAASTLRLGVTLAGLVVWAALLHARGEEELVDVHLPLSRETERQVLARLNALNSVLDRK
jgi:hypothetical protein